MAAVRLHRVETPTDDLEALIGELNTELNALYLPHQRHGLALEALFEPHIRFFTAWSGDEVVGCGGIALFPDFAEVKRMYVRPAWRGRGVADAVMDRLIDETRQTGLPLLRLESGVHSLAAIRFYSRCGFEPCAAFAPYTSMPANGIVTSYFMEMAISGA